MLGIYVHTHWAYNHPYAARTWTIEDWTGFLTGIQALGYDTVMIWPQNETMPVPPTPSDVAFLEKLRSVIDLAHDAFGFQVLIVTTPNVFSNEKAADYTFETRSFWDAYRNVDPKDGPAVDALLRARGAQWAPLAKADGLAIIDSDPGGWPESPSADFARLFQAQAELMRKMNPDCEIYYWMWQGWPPTMDLETYRTTLSILQQRIAGPWQVFSCTELHLEVTDELGMAERRAFFPYNLVETEPSFPLVNANPAWFRQEIRRYDPRVYPRGLMLNAQTHCLQVPRMYLGAHYARGGTVATERLAVIAEKLIPGTGGVMLAAAWQHLEEERDHPMMRYYAAKLRQQVARPQKGGPLSGLMMMPPAQYLADAADNLDIRADFIELRIALDSGREIKKCLRSLLGHLRPYRDRLGYNHTCWGGPLRKRMIDPLLGLNEPAINAAFCPPAGSPPSPKGYLVNFLDAVETYAHS